MNENSGKPDGEQGLYRKYNVERLNDLTGKHRDCHYYVLDLIHDKHAVAALEAYAKSCAAEFPSLAFDLRHEAASLARRLGMPLDGGEASQEGTVMRCNGFQGRQMILQAPEGYRIVCNAEYRVVPVGEYVPQECEMELVHQAQDVNKLLYHSDFKDGSVRVSENGIVTICLRGLCIVRDIKGWHDMAIKAGEIKGLLPVGGGDEPT